MTQFDVSQFLQHGAFVRLPSGKVRVWQGPFEAAKNDNSFINSISYIEFFGSSVTSLKSHHQVFETDTSTLRQFLQPSINGDTLARSAFLPPSFDKYQSSFQTILGKILRSEIEKAVPIVFAESPAVPTAAQLALMIDHVLEGHADLYPFGFWHSGSGLVGASPEVLFELDENSIKTMALAGTAAASNIDQLKSDPKEIHEHMLVVKDIKARLSPFGWVRVDATKAVKIGSVAHLKTEIEVQTSGIDVQKLVKALHPTAALGVYPRNYGLGWMKDLPYQNQRGVFGAPVLFPISQNKILGLVAIRCLQWNSEGSQIGTGGGLVKDSQLQAEWEELALKRESVMKVLGLKP